MAVTREGVRRAAGALYVFVSVFAFLAVLSVGGTLAGAFGAAFVLGLPFALVGSLAALPETVRGAWADRRTFLPVLLGAYALLFGWKRYMAATNMTKAERLHGTVIAAFLLPTLAVAAFILLGRKRPRGENAAPPRGCYALCSLRRRARVCPASPTRATSRTTSGRSSRPT